MNWFQIKRAAALVLAALLVLSGCQDPGAMEDPALETSEAPDPSQSEPVESVPTIEDSAPPSQSEPTDSGDPEETDPPEHMATQTQAPAGPPVAGLVGKGESVTEEWFADAVFVGDSRTDGLRLYSGIKGCSFISYKGLSVFNITSKECIDTEDGKVTALTALGRQQWAKVYLMLGVNELGYGSESFRTAFTSLVEEIKAIQPDATLYVQTILPVNEAIAKNKGISSSINNERVKLFNGIIEEVVGSQGAALVDVAANFWTEEGNMAAENTSDGVHLTRQGYVSWYEYLKCHTGTTELLEEPGTHIFVPGSEPEPSAEPDPEETGEPQPPEETGDPKEGETPQPQGGEGEPPAETDLQPPEGPGGETTGEGSGG